MKLTTKSEYSLLALIYIARHGTERYVKMEDICKEYDLSKKYLEQLLLMLKQNRFLKAKTGAGGGYQLATPADQISVAAIVRLMDGALAATGSASKYYYSQTHLEKEQKIIEVMREIRSYVAERLENLKISDLV